MVVPANELTARGTGRMQMQESFSERLRGKGFLRYVVILMAAVTAFAAENAWVKVERLKSGSELRIFKTKSSKPVLATMEKLTGDSLLVATKTEELAIPRDEILRIDARPAASGHHVTTETKGSVGGAPAGSIQDREQSALPSGRMEGGGYSSSATFGGGKPDFVTVYRRTAASNKPVRSDHH
jgi:hypothetical protein